MDNSSRSQAAHSLRLGSHSAVEDKLSKLQAKARDKAKARARRFDTIGHLGPEAIVAFVDGEMEGKSAHRVRVHLVHCEECRDEVRDQLGASQWVQQCAGTDEIRAPRDLLAKLAQIATTCANDSQSQDSDNRASTPRGAYGSEQDIFDKLEMIMRAIKHNQRSN